MSAVPVYVFVASFIDTIRAYMSKVTHMNIRLPNSISNHSLASFSSKLRPTILTGASAMHFLTNENRSMHHKFALV